jgi:transposase
VDLVYPDGITCKSCKVVTKHYPITGRKVYSCGTCGSQVSPLVGTIFESTKTPLPKWFYAMYLMATNKAGTSAAQLSRELGVKWDTAHHMMMQIRQLMEPDTEPLEGEVEIDETFIHANTFKRSSAARRYGWDARRTGHVVFGVVSRRTGEARAYHVRAAGERVLTPLIRANVKAGSLIHSDGYGAYRKLPNWGYRHRTTNHSKLEFYREDSSTQRIENFWSTWKPRMKGTYKSVSREYLQEYANEFAWRYTHREKPSMFWSLMARVKN